MNIRFKEVELKNFFSFENAKIDLSQQGFVLVEGINTNPLDNAKSNGAGKSAISEAIMFATLGETLRGTKDVARHGNMEGCYVTLKFSIDNDEYILTRYKDHPKLGNNIIVIKNNEDISGKGIRDTELILKQELRDLSKDVIGGVIILGQGLPQKFTNNSAVEKKAILEKISQSDYMIDDIKSKLNKRKSDLQTELRSFEDNILGNEREKSLKLLEVQNNTYSLNTLEDVNNSILQFNESKKQAEDLNTNLDNKKLERNKIDQDIFNLSQDILKLNEMLNQKKDNETKELREVLKPLWAKKSNSELRIKQLETEIKKANNIKDVCPTCGSKIEGVIKINIEPLQEELAEMKETIRKAELDTLQTEDSIRLIELSYLNSNDVKNLNQKQSDLQTLRNQLDVTIRNLDNDYRQSLNSIALLKQKIDSHESQKLSLQNAIIIAEKRIVELDNLIKLDSDKKQEVEERLQIIQKLLNTAQREFRTFLLDSIIVYIDKRVKYYSKHLFNSEAEFKQDGNAIWIGYDNKQYENLSGGEKQKIDICVQFSLRDMLVDMLDFNSNILYIDEIFDNLDSVGTENLINLIINELNNIDSVFIITHHTDTMIPYDKKLTLVKDETKITKLLQI